MNDVTPEASQTGSKDSREPLSWSASRPAAERQAEPALTRFLGGSPASVLVRLIFISLIVGALLMWLDIRPEDIFLGIQRAIDRLWSLGFDAVHLVVRYIVAGAVIVVPVWFVLRLLNTRGS
jgi:hypothetical protein